MSIRQSKKMGALPVGHIRCTKCRGKGELYKTGENKYMRVNAGGKLTTCPLCCGKGHIMTLEAKAKQLKDNADAKPKAPKKVVKKTSTK